MQPNEQRAVCLDKSITEDVVSWFRLGRGHEFEFYATDDEVQEWLLTILPAEFAPYRPAGADSIQAGRIYVEHPFRSIIEQGVGAERVTWPVRIVGC